MQLSVLHATLYRYAEPVARSTQIIRLSPYPSARQRTISWELVLPQPAISLRDAFDNITSLLTLDRPYQEIELVARGVIDVDDVDNGEPAGRIDPMVFLRSTPLTEPDDALRAFVEPMRAVCAKLIGRFPVPLKNLNDAMEPLVWIFENLATALNNLKIPGTEISGLTAAVIGVGATKAAGSLGRLRGSLPSYPLWVRMVGAFGGGSGMPSPGTVSGGSAGRSGPRGTIGRGALALGTGAAGLGLALNAV